MVIKTKRQLQIERLQNDNEELQNLIIKLESKLIDLEFEVKKLKELPQSPTEVARERSAYENLLDQYLNGPTDSNGGEPIR